MAVEALIAILLIGAVGGYLGGIVGAGIGATVVPGLILLGIDPVIAIGSSLLLHLLISPLGGISHYKFGHVSRGIFLPLILVGVFGAFLGANISVNLPAEGLRLLVGISTITAGFIITVKYPRLNHRNSKLASISRRLRSARTPLVGLIALIAGLSHGALGTGWGPLGVSLLILIGIPPHTAVGSSLLARSFVALAGASTYYFLNGVQTNIVLPLLVGGSVAILFGALTAKRLPPRILKQIVGVAVIVLGGSVLVKEVI